MRAYHLAATTSVLVFILLLVGGVVHATGSSLACPDWPLCYGEAFPRMVGGVFFEHSHRLVATLVGFCTLVLAALLVYGTRKSHALRPGIAAFVLILAQGLQVGAAVTSGLERPEAALAMFVALFGVILVLVVRVARHGELASALGLVALEAVVAQGLLGGVTVVLRLPFLVSTAHLGLSFAFFALLAGLTLLLRGEAPRTLAPLVPRWSVALAAAAVFAQCVLGALVRHTASGMACGATLLTCQGSVVPSNGPALLHFGHRLMAVAVTALVIWATLLPLSTVRREPTDPRRPLVRLLALAAHGLVVVQVLLGALTVLSYISMTLVTAHLGVGALLFVDLVLLFLALGRLGASRSLAAAPMGPLAQAAG
jgi:heme A synthase